MSFPGPQRNKIEYFLHHTYEDRGGKEMPKQEVVKGVSRFKFAPDIQVFFEEVPDETYDEGGLIDELNNVIRKRGREQAIGGLLEKRQDFPPEWEKAYREEYGG